ncbi:hypothetical protein TB2_005739 [Malus domestica]
MAIARALVLFCIVTYALSTAFRGEAEQDCCHEETCCRDYLQVKICKTASCDYFCLEECGQSGSCIVKEVRGLYLPHCRCCTIPSPPPPPGGEIQGSFSPRPVYSPEDK